MNTSNIQVNIGQGNLLHSVVQKGYIGVVDTLLNAGMEVDCRTSNGFTPAMIAAILDNSGMLKFLLDKGADPNAECNNGISILLYSMGYNDNSQSEILNEKTGLSVNDRENIESKEYATHEEGDEEEEETPGLDGRDERRETPVE